jgi:molecular chaperone DnaK (HSP70)
LIDGTGMAPKHKKASTDSLKEYRTKFADEQAFEKLVSTVVTEEEKVKQIMDLTSSKAKAKAAPAKKDFRSFMKA